MPKIKEIETILQENIKKLIGYNPLSKRSKVPQGVLAGKGVAQATMNRIIHGQVKTRIDIVAVIAARFQLEAWQLMIDGFDPANPPRLESPENARLIAAVEALLKNPHQLHSGSNGGATPPVATAAPPGGRKKLSPAPQRAHAIAKKRDPA